MCRNFHPSRICHLSAIYLPTYLSIYLPVYHLFICLPTHRYPSVCVVSTPVGQVAAVGPKAAARADTVSCPAPLERV